jgi:hypothetical protein
MLSSNSPPPPSGGRRLTQITSVLSRMLGEEILFGDAQDFISLLAKAQSHENALATKKLLESINLNIIIRHFFPTLQLSKIIIKFLLDSKIIIRSSTPLYTYQHSSGTRERYEHITNFNMLFILINYGLNFRIMSVPDDSRIGRWQTNLLERFFTKNDDEKIDYTIEIIPTSSDLSLSLELLPVIEKMADDFILPIFDNPQRAYELRHLRDELSKSLKQWRSNVEQTILHVHENLLILPKSDYVNDPLESLVTENVSDMVRDDKSESGIASLSGPLFEIFADENGHLEIKNSGFSVEPEKQGIFTTFFNQFFILHLCSLAKTHAEFVASSAQTSPYKNSDKPLPKANYSLEIWLYGILSHTNHYPLDQLIAHWQAFKVRLTDRSISAWIFPITSIHLSTKEFEVLLVGKNLQIFRDAFAAYHEYEKVIDQRLQIEKMPTKEILEAILNPAKEDITLDHCYYIRKFKDNNRCLNKNDLDQEFNVNQSVASLLRVRPATLILPKIPIDTYESHWHHCSGVVIITPPLGNVEMVGYKRPAHSDRLVGDHNYALGFPHSSEHLLRYQGGKPSYNEKEFARRINTIYDRSRAQFPDLSRKEFYSVYMHDFPDQQALNRPLHVKDFKFTSNVNELAVLLGNENYDSSKHNSDNFKSINEFYNFISMKLNKQHYRESIKLYYLSLFKKIIHHAIEKNISFSDALHDMQQISKKERYERIRSNGGSNAVLHAGFFLSHATGMSTKYSVVIGKSASTIASNEALLQGLMIKSKDHHALRSPIITEPTSSTTLLSLQQTEIQNRHGNYAAIYVNIKPKVFNYEISGAVVPIKMLGIVNAIILYGYILETFKQDLPFALYSPTSERKFQLYSAMEFKSLYQTYWDQAEMVGGIKENIEKAIVPKDPNVFKVESSSSPSPVNANNNLASANTPMLTYQIRGESENSGNLINILLGQISDNFLTDIFSLETLTAGEKVKYKYDLALKFQAHDKVTGEASLGEIEITHESDLFAYKTDTFTNNRNNLFPIKLHVKISNHFDKFLQSGFTNITKQFMFIGIIKFDNIVRSFGKIRSKTKSYPSISSSSSSSTRSISSSLTPTSTALASLPLAPSTAVGQNTVATPAVATMGVFAIPQAAVAIPAINPAAATLTTATAVNDTKKKPAKRKR